MADIVLINPRFEVWYWALAGVEPAELLKLPDRQTSRDGRACLSAFIDDGQRELGGKDEISIWPQTALSMRIRCRAYPFARPMGRLALGPLRSF
jgi:hypothetical protein